MTAILTGDIIGSRKALETQNWMIPLRAVLNHFGDAPSEWEIYRGDSFQLEIKDPAKAFQAAILIKATIRQLKKMDVRIAIGIGEKTFTAENISSSNGSAFLRSGSSFDQLKAEKQTLSLNTGNAETDYELNTAIRLALALIDRWTPGMSELAAISLLHPDKSQQDIAVLLQVSQATIGAGLKRAHFSLIEELDQLYRKKISAIFNT